VARCTDAKGDVLRKNKKYFARGRNCCAALEGQRSARNLLQLRVRLIVPQNLAEIPFCRV
jgi:hypothetical protein